MTGTRKLRFLHLHSSFDPGGKELRAVQLMNALGAGIEHSIVSAVPDALGAAARISSSIAVGYPDFPDLAGRPTPWRLKHIAEQMQGFDLVLTYNWGAMDAAMAHTMFARHFGLPPLVHHEDGFNRDEADGLKRRRNWYRRIALGRTAALVVPSRRLEEIAVGVWHQPAERVQRIANGIATASYGRRPRPDSLPRLIKREGEYWIGTLAGLRAVKNLPRLVRTFAHLPEDWHLVIIGEGPERDTILGEALRLGVSHRVHLPGFAEDPAKVVGLFDLFALSSDSEQFPISVVEAMAAGLAVVAPAVGDVAAMVSSLNAPYIVTPGDEPAMALTLNELAGNPKLRDRIGAANAEKARQEFDEQSMVEAYRKVYSSALGREMP